MEDATKARGGPMILGVAGADRYKALVGRLKDALGCDRASFFLVEREKGEVWSKAVTDLEIAEIRLPMNRGVVGYVARTGRMLNLKDVYNDPRFDRNIDKRTGYRTKSLLTMAIRDADHEILGVLQALNKIGGDFTAADEETMARYCGDGLGVIQTGA